jgi:hypothetical protein
MHGSGTHLGAWVRRHQILSAILCLALLLGMAGGTVAWMLRQNITSVPPRGQECGQVLQYLFDESASASAVSVQVINCFWRAYQHCQAATMIQQDQGFDIGSTSTLTIEQQGTGCVLFVDEAIDNNTARSERTFVCTRMSRKEESLHVSGCDHNRPAFDIAPVMITTAQCGEVGGPVASASPNEVEQCFAQGFKDCLADELTYVVGVDPNWVYRDFWINSQCGISYQRDRSPIASCAGLQQRSDGLLFQACGAEGDILVPGGLLPGEAMQPLCDQVGFSGSACGSIHGGLL